MDSDRKKKKSKSHKRSSEEGGSKKRRRMDDISQFIAMEAEESDDDDDESWDDDDEVDIEERKQAQAERQHLEQLYRSGETNRFDKVLHDIEARYRDGQEEDDELFDFDQIDRQYDDEDVGGFSVPQHDPSSDPKLWLVRLRSSGKERMAALQVANLAQERILKGAAFPIMSVFAPEALSGFLYVEAHSQQHIIQALAQLQSIDTSAARIKAVPLNEITPTIRTMSAPASNLKVESGDYVRLKRGIYKGDLGRVVDVDLQSMSAYIKLVPRVDFAAMEARQRGDSVPRKSGRPQRKLFVQEDILHFKELRYDRVYDEKLQQSVDKVGAEKFVDGFVLKRVALAQLSAGKDANPTFAELKDFKEDAISNEEFLESAKQTVAAAVATPSFAAGDVIEVRQGDLKGVRGQIVGVHPDTGRLVVAPDSTLHADIAASTPELIFQADELRKVFRVGDRVVVLQGAHKDFTGTVTGVDLDTGVVSVLAPGSNISVRVRPAALRLTAAGVAAESLPSLENYQLGDLVNIPTLANTGVITAISRTRKVSVLLTDGTEINVDVSQLGLKKMTHNAQATDKERNPIFRETVVALVDGDQQNIAEAAKGKVVHVFGTYIFIKVKERVVHGGYVVRRADSLIAIQNISAASVDAASGANGQNAARPAEKKGIAKCVADSLMGRRVLITSGPYKGRTGTVSHSNRNDPKARLRLDSNSTTISIEKKFLIDEDSKRIAPPQRAHSTAGASSVAGFFARNTPNSGFTNISAAQSQYAPSVAAPSQFGGGFSRAGSVAGDLAAARMYGAPPPPAPPQFGGGFTQPQMNHAHAGMNGMPPPPPAHSAAPSGGAIKHSRGCVVRVTLPGAFCGKRGIVEQLVDAGMNAHVIVASNSDEGDDVISVPLSALGSVRPNSRDQDVIIIRTSHPQHLHRGKVVRLTGESSIEVELVEEQTNKPSGQKITLELSDVCCYEDPGEEDDE